MPLTDAQLAQFHDQGFIVVRGLIDPPRMQALQVEVDDLHERMAAQVPAGVAVSWEDGIAPPRIRQLMGSERVCGHIDAISRGDELLDIMEQLIGPDLLLFHSKLMMKAAHDGTAIPWHQDWGYWQHSEREPTQVNGMLAIDAATEENGAIRFVAGSHRRGAVPHQDLGSSSFSIGLPGELDAYDSVLVEMEAGDVVFFGSLVIHGSGSNRSARHRRANTFAFDRIGNRLAGAWPADRHRRVSVRRRPAESKVWPLTPAPAGRGDR